MSKELICHTHDEILEKINRIRNDIDKTLRYDSDNIDELRGTLEDIHWELNYNIIDLVEEAKESGQSMENRLIEYKDAIVKLGFERVNGEENE